jgi:DNA polymerase III subunit delta
VLSDFQNGKFEPLYLLYGAERFFIDRLQEALLENALAPNEKDFNLDLLYGSEVDAQAALSACRAYPMMATRRVVVIRDFDKMKDNAIFKVLREQFNPACVVFLVCSGKPNLSSHPYRALKEGGRALEFKALYPNQLPNWIKQMAKERGFSMDAKAVQMLSDYVGPSLSAVSAEIEKCLRQRTLCRQVDRRANTMSSNCSGLWVKTVFRMQCGSRNDCCSSLHQAVRKRIVSFLS